MEKPATSQRLRFLHETAYGLASSSPAVSAHLMSEFYKVGHDNETTISDSQRRKACNGCGTISVPGWTSSVSIEREHLTSAPKKERRRDRKQAKSKHASPPDPSTITRPEINVNVECWLCGRKLSQILQHGSTTVTRLERRTPVQGQTPAHRTESGPLRHEPAESKTATTSSQRSRKRMKARKNDSLESKVSKTQNSAPGGTSSLSNMRLMDFLHPNQPA
ncbi:MAG: hypothetical protein M1815_005901 [Lichina confinis]|nr:MAG: hypothetical protein M1815_005901 [Lichina confinis]